MENNIFVAENYFNPQVNNNRLIGESPIGIGLDTFSSLYEDYYVLLCTIADQYLKDKYLVEEVVGEVYLHLWEKQAEIKITSSIKAYLVRSVQNRCINYLEHYKVEEKLKQRIIFENGLQGIPESDEYPLGSLYEKELTSIIEKAMNSLPEQCRKIFLLSRDEGLSYDEISRKLNLSVNTVKTHMKIALAKLREWLKDYLPSIVVALASFCF